MPRQRRCVYGKRGQICFHYPYPSIFTPHFPGPHRQVSPCTASHFLLSGQEKVTKEKATPTSGSGLRPDFPRSGAAPGAVTKGRPCPFVPRSASMPRVPLRNTSTRPPDGERIRVVCESFVFLLLLHEPADNTNRPFQEGERNRPGRG